MKIGIVGGAGRMGRQLIAEVLAHPGLELAGAIDAPNSPYKGQDLGILAGSDAMGLTLGVGAENLFNIVDAIIDFTAPAATMQFTALAAQQKVIHIIGTTGLTSGQEELLKQTAKVAPVVYAANYSLCVNVLLKLTEVAASIMKPEDFDIEISEAHHKHKVDAPSGTALALGRAAANARGVALDEVAVYSRHGHTGERQTGTIGFSVVRGGDLAGEHTVMFAGTGERIELRHHSSDRRGYAKGAVHAALWAKDQPPGLYDMRDVLGI